MKTKQYLWLMKMGISYLILNIMGAVNTLLVIALSIQSRGFKREIQELERENKDVEELYKGMWDRYYKLLDDINKSQYKDAFYKELADARKRKEDK